MRRFAVSVAAALLALPAQSLTAQTLDQNQPDASIRLADFEQIDLAQSFQQSANNIVGAGIFLYPGIGSTDLVRIGLWTGLPNAGGTLLAFGQAMGTQGSWVDVYWESVGVNPGTTYFLVFDGNTTLSVAGSLQNPYPDGQAYANPGYQSFPTFDYTFRTWSGEGAPPPISTVPEPISMVLFGTGLAGMGMIRRRRRREDIA